MSSSNEAVEPKADPDIGASALPEPQTGTAHILSLDGFRGLAVLLVILFHYLPRAGMGPVGLLASFGWSGVDAFLVLSGFLITGILYRQRGAARYFKNFYMRRALRLFPLNYFILLLAFVMSLFVGYAWRREYIGFLFYGANIVMSYDPAGGNLAIFNIRHFWTLALEEQFYLVWPWFLGSSLSRSVLIRLCLAGIGTAILCRIVLFLAHASPWVEYESLPTRMDSLLIGSLIALIPLPSKLAARWCLGVTAPIFAALVLIGRNSFFTSPPIMLAGYTVLAVFYASLLVLALHPGTVAARVLTLPPLRFLGKLSYGLYLWHYLFSSQAEEVTNKIEATIHPQVLAELVVFIVLFSVSILIAMASYKFIERPFLRLKDRFEPNAKLAATG